MPADHFGIGPGTLADELLHGLDVAVFQGLGHGFNRFVFDLEHPAFHTLQRPEALFLTLKRTRISAMVRHQLLLQPVHLPGSEIQSWFAAGGRWQRLRNTFDQFVCTFQSDDSERALYHLECEVTLSY